MRYPCSEREEQRESGVMKPGVLEREAVLPSNEQGLLWSVTERVCERERGIEGYLAHKKTECAIFALATAVFPISLAHTHHVPMHHVVGR